MIIYILCYNINIKSRKKIKMKKSYLKILIIICIINVFISIKLIIDNKYVLNVNSKNREVINSILDDNEEHKLSRVEAYRDWRHYYVVVHSFLKEEKLLILDGDDNLAELFVYVQQNGYKTSTIGYILLISSTIIIILAKKVNKKYL